MIKTTRRIGLALIVGAFVSACAGPEAPPPPDPTVAQVEIVAGADANPDPSGRPSPIVVLVYALKPGAPFATGSYDALSGGELGELAETMSRIGRFVVVPGKSVKNVFELPDGISDVGIVAAYRDVDTAQWRASAPVTPNAVTLLTASVGANAVNVTAK